MKMNYDLLIDELSDLYQGVKSGKIEPSLAHELNSTAENIQGVIRLGLLNAKLQNRAPNLAFFREAVKKAQKAPAPRTRNRTTKARP